MRGKKAEVKTVSSNKEQDQRLEAVKLAIQQIQKTHGAGAIMRFGDTSAEDRQVKVISTGSLSLDHAIGVGGMPRGRVAEVFGPESSGKTTLCLHVIAEAQKNGGTAAFIDAEHALDPARAQSIGVNLDDMLISQPDTGEQALEIAETLIRSGGVDVIIVDSVAALVPKAEIEGEMGDAMMGVQARLMSQAMRKLAGAINRSQTALIFTNQIRMKIGVMFGNPETTPGGRALKFFASVRLDTRKIGNITDPDNKVIGSRHRVRVVKNKVAPPFRDAEFDIMNLGGISKSGDLIDLAEKFAVVEKSGSFYKFDGQVIAQGREAAKTELESNHKLFAAMEKQVKDKMAHEHHLEISPTPKPSTEE